MWLLKTAELIVILAILTVSHAQDGSRIIFQAPQVPVQLSNPEPNEFCDFVRLRSGSSTYFFVKTKKLHFISFSHATSAYFLHFLSDQLVNFFVQIHPNFKAKNR